MVKKWQKLTDSEYILESEPQDLLIDWHWQSLMGWENGPGG